MSNEQNECHANKCFTLQSQTSDNHEALLTQALQSVYECWPWVDLDLIEGQVNVASTKNVQNRGLKNMFWILRIDEFDKASIKTLSPWVTDPCPRDACVYNTVTHQGRKLAVGDKN